LKMFELFDTDTNIRVGSLAAVSFRTTGSKHFLQFGGTSKSEVTFMLVRLLMKTLHLQSTTENLRCHLHLKASLHCDISSTVHSVHLN